MALSSSGQLLVESGMRMLDAPDRRIWSRWSAAGGWSPTDRLPKRLPPEVATVAAAALDKLIGELAWEINNGALSDEDQIDALNDLDAAKATLADLLGRLQPHP
jgi:hypothetical protein